MSAKTTASHAQMSILVIGTDIARINTNSSPMENVLSPVRQEKWSQIQNVHPAHSQIVKFVNTCGTLAKNTVDSVLTDIT